MSSSSGITVGVRVRPFNERERRYDSKNIIRMTADDPGLVQVTTVRKGVLTNEKPKEFQFDHALWSHDRAWKDAPFCTQESVFQIIGAPVVQNVLEGYHSALFAYGQTGSGKTFSMLGFPGEEGLIPRVSENLFDSIQLALADGSSSYANAVVECAYLEIYNEAVCDLLDLRPSPSATMSGLKVRQHPTRGIFVEGLRHVRVASHKEVLELLAEGDRRRRVASTNMNAASSRSHAVLLLRVAMEDDTKTACRVSKLSLVDLAGSERVSSTGAEGDTLAEGASINRSLTVLGMCFDRLAEQSTSADGSKSQLPVPYRDSQLTFLLSESLGGNSKTVMLANVSPASVNADETMSTLRFAQVAKRVKSRATINETPAEKLIRELRMELVGLRKQLLDLEATRPPPPPPPLNRSPCPPEATSDAAGGASVTRADVGVEKESATTAENGAAGETLAELQNDDQPSDARNTSAGWEAANPESGDLAHGEGDDDEGQGVVAQQQSRIAALEEQLKLVEASDYANVRDSESSEPAVGAEMQLSFATNASFADQRFVSTMTERQKELSRVIAEAEGESTKPALFVDWNQPQLVCMTDFVEPVVNAVAPGQCVIVVRGSSLWGVSAVGGNESESLADPSSSSSTSTIIEIPVTYTPMDLRVVVGSPRSSSSSSASLEVDGILVDAAQEVVLSHQSRIVLRTPGYSLLWRLSHCLSLPTAPKFSCAVRPGDGVEGSSTRGMEHLTLLETFLRHKVEEASLTELTSTTLGELSPAGGDQDGSDVADEIDAALAEARQRLYVSEEALAARFPATPVELAAFMKRASQRKRSQSRLSEAEPAATRLSTVSRAANGGCELPVLRVRVLRGSSSSAARSDSDDSEEGDGAEGTSLKAVLLELDSMKRAAEESETRAAAERQELAAQIAAARSERRARQHSMIQRKAPAHRDVHALLDALHERPGDEGPWTEPGSSHLDSRDECAEANADERTPLSAERVPLEGSDKSSSADAAAAEVEYGDSGADSTLAVSDISTVAPVATDAGQSATEPPVAVASSGDVGGEGEMDEGSTATLDAHEELLWQRALKRAHEARPNGPQPSDHPEAADDARTWTFFATEAKDKLPFLKEVHTQQIDYYWNRLAGHNHSPAAAAAAAAAATPHVRQLLPPEEQRSGYVWKLNQGLTSHHWEYRFAILSGRFLYYFYHADGTCRCLATLYIFGCTIHLLPQTFEEKPFVLHLTVTAPRRTKDRATSFYFAFGSEAERCQWAHWIALASVPEVPRSMMKRLFREVESDSSWTLASVARHPACGSLMNFLVPPSRWCQPLGNAAKPRASSATSSGGSSCPLLQEKYLHWDADTVSPTCGLCRGSFGFFKRRHHCRACGGVFCGQCTKTVDMQTAAGDVHKKLACNTCIERGITRVGHGSLVDSNTGGETSGASL